ncbi:anti-anti-sigma regulatory factor, SpoIIAA [Pelagirhabdus alkalitolerans]|uniref:Anti-sigma F factor antagonist n=1 Tax=Pelagirhabdus alkalitolerans TaxID=1612202 RepID=A0A1G6HBU1_9BACI|nr:anti-sigma F factor antagonist [Pelagirhabdus alkalitolerans]SDB91749.1 anti-anti-sigma regulatory factor, SpoIIAA [Pelagirhabdus alkalitolerans]
MLTYQFTMQGNVLIIRLSGELDHHSAKELKAKWQQEQRDQNPDHILLNLEGLTFMDSSGLGVILGRYREFKQPNHEMVVCQLSPLVRRLFDLSGLYKIMQIEKDENLALVYLGVAS